MNLLKVLTTILVLTTVALAGCTTGGDFREEAPVWKAGYTWSAEYGNVYTWDYTSLVEGEPDRDNGTESDGGSLVLRIANTTQTADDGTPYYLAQREYAEGGSGLAAFRKADLASLYIGWNFNSKCINGACSYGITNLAVDDEAGEAPIYLNFPLTPGKIWEETQEEDAFDETVLIIKSRSKVVGEQVLDTAIGPVSTIKVDTITTIPNLNQLLQEFKKVLEDEGFDIDEIRADYTMRSSTYYSPEFLTPMRYEQNEADFFTLSGTFEGEPFQDTERSTTEHWEQITGASLTAGPEIPVADLATFLAGTAPIPNPTGQAVDRPAYAISIVERMNDVNGADGESVGFSATVEGDGLPTGHSIQWVALDWAGKEVATHVGLEFDASLPAGSYTILAGAVDDAGDLISGATADARVHYQTYLDVPCGLVEAVGTGVPSECATISLPIHPGVRTLDVEAFTGSPANFVNIGYLLATDPSGEPMDARARGDPNHLLAADFSDYTLANVPWDLDYQQTVGVAQELSYDIDIRYGGPITVFDMTFVTPEIPPCCPRTSSALQPDFLAKNLDAPRGIAARFL